LGFFGLLRFQKNLKVFKNFFFSLKNGISYTMPNSDPKKKYLFNNWKKKSSFLYQVEILLIEIYKFWGVLEK